MEAFHPMRLRCISLAILCLVSSSMQATQAQTLGSGSLIDGLRRQRDALDVLAFRPDGSPSKIEFQFGASVAEIEGVSHDGFRFRVPLGFGGLDWVWYFEAPASAGSWYIVDLTEPAGGGFRILHSTESTYVGLTPRQAGVWRRLQPLAASFLKEGHEYAVWFHVRSPATDGEKFFAMSTFAPHRDRWRKNEIEEALGLTPVP